MEDPLKHCEHIAIGNVAVCCLQHEAHLDCDHLALLKQGQTLDPKRCPSQGLLTHPDRLRTLAARQLYHQIVRNNLPPIPLRIDPK